LTPAHIFVSCPESSVDYVMAPPHEHRLRHRAFHYHFHSQKADDILQFHQRHYAEPYTATAQRAGAQD
jgi:hypothetical protein